MITGAPSQSPLQSTSVGVSSTVAIGVGLVLVGPGCLRVTVIRDCGYLPMPEDDSPDPLHIPSKKLVLTGCTCENLLDE